MTLAFRAHFCTIFIKRSTDLAAIILHTPKVTGVARTGTDNHMPFTRKSKEGIVRQDGLGSSNVEKIEKIQPKPECKHITVEDPVKVMTAVPLCG